MRISFRHIVLTALCFTGLTSITATAHAETVTTIVVPYGPGGPLDTTARILAESVKDSLGNVIIENRPGAGGNIGLNQVARAKPDGKTLGIAAVATMAINPWLYANMPYDAASDFAAITPIARVPNVLVMNSERAKELGIANVQDLIAYAQGHANQLNYGSGGNGSAGHLAGELFKQMGQLEAVHIPYNGANPAQLALLSKEVDFNFDNLAAAAANIRAGKLLALAVTTEESSPLLSGVPSMAQTLPGFTIDTWWGLVAPANTPAATIAELNKAFAQALESEQTKQRFDLLLAQPITSSAEDFDSFMDAERQRYEPIVKAAGARID